MSGKVCESCGCPTDYEERLVCPMCGTPYGDPEITNAVYDAQRDKTEEELLNAVAQDDFAAAEEYMRRYLAGELRRDQEGG